MSVFIQLPTDPRDAMAAALQRQRFHDHVTAKARSESDRVIVVEPNPHLASGLTTLWADWPSAEVVRTAISPSRGATGEGSQASVIYFRAVEDAPDFASMATDELSLRRRFPNGTIEEVTVPAMGLAELLAHVAPVDRIALLATDGGAGLIADLCALKDVDRIDAVVGSVNALMTPDEVNDLARGLVAAGFQRAGRPWGEAGEAILVINPHSPGERVQAWINDTKVQAGRVLVTARDGWLGPARRQDVWTHLRSRVRQDLSPADILDSGGQALRPISRADVEHSLHQVTVAPVSTWRADEPLADDPWTIARECHDSHGVWPISFSYPRASMPLQAAPRSLVGLITPGFPYSFESEGEYLQAYADGYWGITHRKAGWDCFRHVEILASGALPWMLDAAEIPRFSMVHYPKKTMAEAALAMGRGGRVPDEATRLAFRDFFLRHLTAEAMARYVLLAAGLQDSPSILFVDERLPHHADYQSVLTLIGLKQLLGRNCHVLHPVDYIYDDTTADTSRLYGRGFGYSRSIPGSARSAGERSGQAGLPEGVDTVVVGSITRNQDGARKLLDQFSPERTIWIHGEDLPPTIDEVSHYRRSRVHMFVRAIHRNR